MKLDDLTFLDWLGLRRHMRETLEPHDLWLELPHKYGA
ncbi:Uncharacterised protein [Mycobacteroides abscessus subsp. abscessus]|nr:Uncharacterised protein [Mycobacteroides abscessus subsp. abscessus]